jgi:hypothetical protein
MKRDEQRGEVKSNVAVNVQDSCPDVTSGLEQSSEDSK